MTDKSTFVLKLSGIDLDNIKAGDIGRLLNDFCKLLDDDHLHFENIYSGSAVLKVRTEPEYYAEKIETLSLSLAKNSPALDDEDMELVHHIEFRKPLSQSFEQSETFIGKLLRPAHGKDDTDHFTILLANDKTISVSVPKSLSYDLAPHLESLWRFESLVKFTGTTCYEIQQGYTLILKSFNATGFEI